MKKGKKRLLLGWICLLLSLCMVTVASAETDGTPIQPCHQVTMTERKSTAQNGASISVWHITTALGTVDAELNALADDYAAELSPLLQKPGRERTQNSTLTVRILHSRTGMSWMSFMVQARLEYHRQIQQVRFTTRTYDMLTGQRITLADIFPADSPAWALISQTVRDTANAYYPDETPDAAAVEVLCENLAQADFMLYGMSLVIPLPSVYENHPQLMQATLYYPQIRAYMTEEAQRQTDNASLYRFCALTYDDGPNQWITPHVLDALMKTGARATFFLVGSRVSDFPYLARQEHDEGHAIATHFYEHLYANQEDWSGKYIIGYKASSGVRILTGANSGNYANMSDAGDFDQYMDGDNIVSNVDTDIYACTFEKTVNGYSIHCADGYIGYTSTATSKNNNLWFSPNIVEKQYEWTISYSKCVEIQNVYNTKRIIWANASANRFAGYTSKQQEVILYKYME